LVIELAKSLDASFCYDRLKDTLGIGSRNGLRRLIPICTPVAEKFVNNAGSGF